MAIRKTRAKKLQKTIFIVITVLLSIGLVIPLLGIFSNQGQVPNGITDNDADKKTPQEKMAELEGKKKESPGDTKILLKLAEAYLSAGKVDQAIKEYEQVLALEPENVQVRLSLANIYYLIDKYDLAAGQLEELLKQNPQDKNARYLYGLVLAEGKGDYAGGIREMEKFIELAPAGPGVENAKQKISEWRAKIKE
ncbi:MAG: tetratricopeptide repeat protein [Peptococcaceae bacterium]|nr:MAG: tetratricopeptide repeat protein [Peptococcaceae bacterium]